MADRSAGASRRRLAVGFPTALAGGRTSRTAWLRALPLTVSVGLAVRLSDLVQRRRTRIVTYGMENSDPDVLLAGIPRPLHRLFSA